MDVHDSYRGYIDDVDPIIDIYLHNEVVSCINKFESHCSRGWPH